MQAEDSEIEHFLNELYGLVREMLLVADEGEDHTHGQYVAQSEPRRQIDRDDVLKPEDHVVESAECNLCLAQPHIAIDDIAVTIEPLALSFALAVKEFQTLDRPHALDEN